MEIVCKLIGLCICFVPSVYFAVYMVKRATVEQRFDIHLRKVNDVAGKVGIIIAVFNRLALFILITCLGLYITSYFDNNVTLDIVIVSFIAYIISLYIDNKNDI